MVHHSTGCEIISKFAVLYQQQRLCVEGRMGPYWNWNKSQWGKVIPYQLNFFLSYFCQFFIAYCRIYLLLMFSKKDWRSSVVSGCLLRCIYSTVDETQVFWFPSMITLWLQDCYLWRDLKFSTTSTSIFWTRLEDSSSIFLDCARQAE
jgi:hypothetical protein